MRLDMLKRLPLPVLLFPARPGASFVILDRVRADR